MKIEHEQGFLIHAVNNSDTDYVHCARVLAKSLRFWHPDAKICLMTDQILIDHEFDYVRILPKGDVSKSDWKLANDWQCFFASPFRETIKIEADCLIASPIDHWWEHFRHKEICLTVGCYDYHGNRSTNRRYRNFIDNNSLLDIYNGLTYWRLSKLAKDFFLRVGDIFSDWENYIRHFKQSLDQEPNTDFAYAIAASFFDQELLWIPNSPSKFVHMKPAIVGTGKEWHKDLTWEIDRGSVRINGMTQHGVVHYHEKQLAKEFAKYYE